jgi:sugar/nucleoside kinase (ribokinase family)
MAFQRDIPLVLDLALPPLYHSRDSILSLLPRLWLLSLNEEELAVLLPGYSVFQALDKLLQAGVDSVALKRGPRGCMIAHNSERLDVLPPVVEAIDTNGCGDAFTTGCAWARLQGADLNACADVANLLGALTSMRPGSADALPTRDELLVYLDEELWWIIGEKSITP